MEVRRTISNQSMNDFPDLMAKRYQNSLVYFDKTSLIPDLYDKMDNRDKHLVMIWPSGFGKSLFLSMLNSFEDVEGNTKLFHSGFPLFRKHPEYLDKKGNECINIYIDFQTVQPTSYESFESQMRSFSDHLTESMVDKLIRIRSCFSVSDSIFENAINSIRTMKDCEYFGWVIQGICECLTDVLNVHYSRINIIIDSLDAPIRYGLTNGGVKLAEKIQDEMVRLLPSSTNYNRCIVASQLSIPFTHSFRKLATFANLYSSMTSRRFLELGVSEKELLDKFNLSKKYLMAQSYGWYHTGPFKQIRPSDLSVECNISAPERHVLESEKLMIAFIETLTVNELEVLKDHVETSDVTSQSEHQSKNIGLRLCWDDLSLFNKPELRSDELNKEEYIPFVPLLMTGHITIKDPIKKDNYRFLNANLVAPNKSRADELCRAINNRMESLIKNNESAHSPLFFTRSSQSNLLCEQSLRAVPK